MCKRNAGCVAEIQYFGICQSLVRAESDSFLYPALPLYETVRLSNSFSCFTKYILYYFYAFSYLLL